VQPPPSRAHHGNIAAVVEVLERAQEQTWYHTLEMPDGQVTPGIFDLRPYVARYGIPGRLDGMRAEREDLAKRRQGVSPVERIVVVSVVLCVVAFEVWFFLFAGSSIGHG
jgi:hypothetical protein